MADTAVQLPGPPPEGPACGTKPEQAAAAAAAAAAPAGVEEFDDEEIDMVGVAGRVRPPDEDTTCILSIIPEEHDRIKGLYRRYKDPTDTPHQRQLLVYQLLRELSVLTAAEEVVLLPVVGEQVDAHMRAHALDEHESITLFCSDLEGMKLGDDGFEAKVQQLMETFLEHAHEAEHRMLPALRAALDDDALHELGKRYLAAKQHLPTRPHPGATSKHVDDATVLMDAAKDAAQFEGTPPAIGTPSTDVLRKPEAGAEAQE